MKQNARETIKHWSLKLCLVLFDVFAVLFSYYIALFVRFYVNHRFHTGSRPFFMAFFKFAPYYVVCCVIVFALFKLYSSIWKYAGMGDMNRILGANAVTCAIHVLGTLLFVRRMPTTYYFIGALIQFVLITLSRFGYRVVTVELARVRRDKGSDSSVNVLIIGTGESAKSILKLLADDKENVARPVCLVDYRGMASGRLFDGFPVVSGLDSIAQAAERYQAKGVIIADSLMPQETRASVKAICKDHDIVVQDFSGYSPVAGLGVTLNKLLEYVDSPVEIRFEGKVQRFDNGEQAAMVLTGRYNVKSVSARDNRLAIEIETGILPSSSVDESWLREYEKVTGEEVSFF